MTRWRFYGGGASRGCWLRTRVPGARCEMRLKLANRRIAGSLRARRGTEVGPVVAEAAEKSGRRRDFSGRVGGRSGSDWRGSGVGRGMELVDETAGSRNREV